MSTTKDYLKQIGLEGLEEFVTENNLTIKMKFNPCQGYEYWIPYRFYKIYIGRKGSFKEYIKTLDEIKEEYYEIKEEEKEEKLRIEHLTAIYNMAEEIKNLVADGLNTDEASYLILRKLKAEYKSNASAFRKEMLEIRIKAVEEIRELLK